MDVSHKDFTSRIASNPSLYKHCGVVWKESWERDSILQQITSLSLKKAAVDASPDLQLLLLDYMTKVLWTLKHPQKDVVSSRLKRLKAGVDKLTETRNAVAKMQKKAAKKSKILAEKQAEADQALLQITQSMTGANEQKSSMETLKAATQEENVKIEEQKKEAVGSIKSESLSEIRSLRAPPETIRDILQAVLLFMGILDNSWEAMRKFLAKSGVKDEIINFDARRITADVAKKVEALLKAKGASLILRQFQFSFENLANAEKEMENLSHGLSSIGQKVDELKSNFELSMKDATQIKIDLDREMATIAVAGTLVDRLRGEYDRWQDQMKALEEELRQMERCCLISAAFVTFLGVATEELRETTLNKWLSLCNLPNSFKFVSFLTPETEQLTWKEKGIPASAIAVENASIIFNNTQTVFVIDPTGRVSQFLANCFKANLQILKGNQHDLLTQIEMGVRFGKTLVIEDVDVVEPACVVQLGEKQVDLNDNFKMFLCSKNEQIKLPEYVQSAVSVVNFSTTKSGLASQLLSLAIEIEKPELEEKCKKLVSEAEVLKIQLDQLEQQLLNELANSEGKNAEKIGKSLAESEKLQKELDKERNVYESFVQKCSQLYFGINQLHHRNHVYNFNVNTVIKLFKKTFTESKKDVNSESRLDSLYRSLQWLVYDTVSRAMFKADRLMFAMEFIHVAQPSAFLKNEWEMFLGQLIKSRRLDVAKLQTHLPTLYHALNIEDQQTWSTFSVLRNVKALRPDRLYSAMNKFGCQMLAVKSLNNSLDLHKLFKEESSAKEPILMFIGAGADPSQELSEFASKCIGPGKFHQIAMGKGLERSVLDNSDKLLVKESGCASAMFIWWLWLVAEPDDHFPTVFLQECIKLTYEAPPGIKNNLQRTYSQWVQNAAEMNNAGDMDLRLKSVFVMSWLHAVLQERRNFIPQGWLKFYEFSNADIKAGKHVLDYLFQVASKSANSEFDWESLRGLLQDTIYGGRIENALDMGALNAYLSDFFNSSMISKSKEVSIPQVLRVPSLNSLQEYAGWISSNFPAENLPLFLGLPRNISFFWEITQSSETIFQLRQLRQLGSLKELTFSRDLWSQGLTPLLNLWKKLNQNSNLHSSTISETGVANDPFEEILQLEYVYAKKLIHIVHSSLTIISKTIKGTINADAKTIELAKALLSQEIPASWDSSWTGTKNLREYMEQLIHKAKAIQNLLGVASKGSLLEDKSLSLAQLFRPVALLNALRQVTARKKQTSMEKLRLATAWQASQLASETHIVLSNLQLQGALFDGKELRPVGQTSPALSTTAPLYIAWVAEEGQSQAERQWCDIPLFTNSDRSNLVTMATIPCQPDMQNTWKIAGLALFLE
uniref:Cytoplasmic dynein 2 heavy chain 1 n=1 Tax=Ditylenchus dipsaci TaxID=166011 RepID=A0A915E5T1_9BILA